MYFQATLNAIPWITLVNSFVCSPRRNSPDTPSFSTICEITCLQVSLSLDVCLKVFTTRIELLMQSETTVQRNPIPADLRRAFPKSLLQLQRGRQCYRQLFVTNQGQCPATVAKPDAIPPWQKAEMPFALNLVNSTFRPSGPQTCLLVFQASTGKVDNLHTPASTEPNEVCTKIGSFLSSAFSLNVVVASMLAAVSPKREMGPMMRAGMMPRQKRTIPPSLQSTLRVCIKPPPFLNWQFMVVRIHMRELTCTAIAEAPATPDLAAFRTIQPTVAGLGAGAQLEEDFSAIWLSNNEMNWIVMLLY